VRVVRTSDAGVVALDVLAADLAAADVVFVGEDHADPRTHQVEAALAAMIAARRAGVALALEMFERDVQEPLDHFQMGHMDEAEMLALTRPWPRYATDYKPLVDVAVSHGWAVIAANVPRRIAADVARAGLDVLETADAGDAALFARELRCPADDAYARRFRDAMDEHDPDAERRPADAGSVARYYAAQCLKDETMAESIASAGATGPIGGPRRLVVSINGLFHSDYRQGVVERTQRRVPDAHIRVLSLLPVADVRTAAPAPDDLTRADYLVYVQR
jgi:uncharacterized iron-regulated protein